MIIFINFFQKGILIIFQNNNVWLQFQKKIKYSIYFEKYFLISIGNWSKIMHTVEKNAIIRIAIYLKKYNFS